MLEGEAGIGKTTLWRWTLDTARARGFAVLSASPAAAETALSFSALDDLLEPVVGDVLPRLAPPRRAALEAALLLTADQRATPEVHAIAAGLRDAVRALAEDAPVLVAIDDIQWIDRPSAAALAHALRRLGDTRVGLAVARRSEPGMRLPIELDRAFAPDRLERVRVSALSLGALNRIVAQRLDLRLPRPVLRRIVEAVGGNPFFALEPGSPASACSRPPGTWTRDKEERDESDDPRHGARGGGRGRGLRQRRLRRPHGRGIGQAEEGRGGAAGHRAEARGQDRAREITFDKKRLTAPAGRIGIELTNPTELGHNVRIQTGKRCCFAPGHEDLGGTTTGVGKVTGTVHLKPGRYFFLCSVGGHWQLGQWGTLVVK